VKKIAAAPDDLDAIDLAKTWETLYGRCQNNEPEAQDRMDLILRIREKIKEYRMTLLPWNLQGYDS